MEKREKIYEGKAKQLFTTDNPDLLVQYFKDEATAFDGKKAGLKAKWDAIKDAVGFQVSADTKKKLEDSVTSNMKNLVDVSTKNAMKMAEDPDAVKKFEALMKDYQSIFEMPKK